MSSQVEVGSSNRCTAQEILGNNTATRRQAFDSGCAEAVSPARKWHHLHLPRRLTLLLYRGCGCCSKDLWLGTATAFGYERQQLRLHSLPVLLRNLQGVGLQSLGGFCADRAVIPAGGGAAGGQALMCQEAVTLHELKYKHVPFVAADL